MQPYASHSLILLAIVVYFFYLLSNIDHEANYFVISATYFSKSNFYPDDTVVVLFNAKKSIVQSKEFMCVSANLTIAKYLDETNVRYSNNPSSMCQYVTYIAVCRVLANPTSFGVTKFEGNLAKIPLRKPYREKTPVVVCFSPLFYFEKWELLVTSLEVYKYYGADLQVLYIQSMLEEIYNLLKIYAKNKIVAIEPWAAHVVDQKGVDRIGVDPNLQLDWRNQAAAHTDCTVKYREAADFIIVADVDDVLVPTLGKPYLSEFAKLSTSFPNSMGFAYHRFTVVAASSTEPEDYSLSKVLSSLRISHQKETFKHVLIPKKVETAWLHWPGIFAADSELIVLPENHYMFHLRNWTSTNTADLKFHSHPRQTTAFITPKDELLMGIDFLEGMATTEEFSKLSKTRIYSDLIADCYEKIFYSVRRQPVSCPGPARCSYAPQPGLHCVVAKKYLTSTVVNRNLWIFSSSNEALFKTYKTGCAIN